MTTRWPVQDHGAWGYVDAGGALVVPFRLRGARSEREGRCAAADERGWGYLAPDGTWAVAPAFTSAESFQRGLAVVRGPAAGVIDRDGAVVVPLEWEQVWRESGRAWRVQRDGRIGWLRPDGTPLVPPAFTRPLGSSGLVVATGTGPVRVDLEHGHVRPLPAVDEVGWPGADTVPARLGDRWGWLGPDDRFLAPPAWGYTTAFEGGVAVVRAGLGEFGLVDRAGEVLVPLRWRSLVRVGDRLWATDTDGAWLLDLSGQALSGPWLQVLNLSRLLLVRGPAGWGAVDLDGNELLEPRHEVLREGGGGWLCASEGGRFGWLDPLAGWTIPPRFADAAPFDGALAEVDGGRGLVDREGRVVWTRSPPRAPRIVAAPRRAPDWRGARDRLAALRAAPPAVFGGGSHHFALGPPRTSDEVAALPPILRAFLLEVGDGPGAPGARYGAGPGHGLYAIADALADAPDAGALFVPPRGRAEVEADERDLPAGLVVIGTHGCAWDYGVVLTGPYADTVWQHVDPGWIPSTPAFAEVLAAHHGDHRAAQEWLWAHVDEVPIDTFADAWLGWLRDLL